jgi:redox-sensitive bicupin YhaK (pirin superfamily)
VEDRRGRLRLVGHPQGLDGAVTLHQDAEMFVANLAAAGRRTHEIRRGRGLWLQVARGIIALDGTEMREGDGAAIENQPAIAIDAETDAEILLFDLA